MPDVILGSLVFVPPFFAILFAGFFLWLFVRGFYRSALYKSDLWHPALIDVSVMAICFYATHLIMLVLRT
ncbi:MAG: DUF1656 domain-containing protein [Candidatus Adiutrix sp.]